MRVQRGTSNQNARLQSLLKEIDVEWESLTQSIQADRALLNTIQPRIEHLHRQLALIPGAMVDSSPALTAHLRAMERRAGELRQIIQLKEQQRKALERHFDQARLAAAAQRQPNTPQGLRRRYSTGKAALSRPLVRLLRGVRKSLHPSDMGKERVSDDSPFSNTRP